MSTELIFEALMEKLSTFHQLSPGLINQLKPLLIIRKIERGELLIKAGYRTSNLWFLMDGFAREIGHDEEYERTSWFYFSGDFMYSYPSFFSQLPAFRDIELLSKSVVIEISYKDLLILRHDFEEINLIIDLARGQCESERGRYASENHTLSAKERYMQFYKRHKTLFNIARHKDIASFLRIKTDGFRRYNH